MICPVLESPGDKKSIFIGWGAMCFNPHRLGGEVDFFHYSNRQYLFFLCETLSAASCIVAMLLAK
jgi:hypothetical protein